MKSSAIGVVLAVVWTCGVTQKTWGAADTQRPNILFILADDLGWGDPSCYGNSKFRTPNLDRLARQGTLFTQYYQGGSVCSPSRGTLLTGRWPSELRLHGHLATAKQNEERAMVQFLDPANATLPRLLKQGGYVTAHVGKWHLGRPPDAGESLAAYGFDTARWIDGKSGSTNVWAIEERPRATKLLVDETLAVLDEVKTKPFFCQLWLNDPHAALAPSDEQMAPFRRQVPKGFTSPFEVYAATVTEMDRQIGRVLDKLDELGLSKNTLVIFSSDNGPEDIEISNASWSGIGSAGPLRGRKRSLYEGGTRVPFIVRWPQGGTPAGQVNTQTVVSGADLLPTVCELAGVTVAAEAQAALRGQSVAAALKGDKTFRRSVPLMWEWRYRVFNHPWNRSPILAIRDGGWKLLLNPDRSRVELYDVERDPGEQDNVAAGHIEVVKRLSERVLAWQKSLPPGPVEPAAGLNDYAWPQEGALSKRAVERGPMFERSDKDKDGELSQDEYLSNFPEKEKHVGTRRFPLFDVNKDGRLSRDEFIYMGQ
jgi:N-acetylgalactosamine-6-sulfatase